MDDSNPDEGWYIYHIWSKINDILAIIAFIALGSASVLILSYLNGVSLSKRCLILYLYKDMVSSILLFRTFVTMQTLLSYLNEEGTNKILAILVSYSFSCNILYTALNLIFISINRFYMAKSNMIDPQMPMMGGDEKDAIRRVRILCCLIVVVFTTTTFGLGLYPSIFYILTLGQDVEVSFLMSSSLYKGTIILLISISGIITIAKRYYEANNEFLIDKMIPKAIKYLSVLGVLKLMLPAIAEIADLADKITIWNFNQSITSTFFIIVPFVLILRSDQLKTHSIRVLKNVYDDAFLYSIYLVPTFLFLVINAALGMF